MMRPYFVVLAFIGSIAAANQTLADCPVTMKKLMKADVQGFRIYSKEEDYAAARVTFSYEHTSNRMLISDATNGKPVIVVEDWRRYVGLLSPNVDQLVLLTVAKNGNIDALDLVTGAKAEVDLNDTGSIQLRDKYGNVVGIVNRATVSAKYNKYRIAMGPINFGPVAGDIVSRPMLLDKYGNASRRGEPDYRVNSTLRSNGQLDALGNLSREGSVAP